MSELMEKKPVIRVAFLDVGQGDTIVITCPETHEAIVVDCIDDQAVLKYLKREDVQYLRGVVVTHSHADHYKGIADLLNNCAHKLGIEGCEMLASSEDIANLRDMKAGLPDHDGHSTIYDEPRERRRSALANLHQWTVENEKRCGLLRDVRNVLLPFEGELAQNLRLLHPPLVKYSELRQSGLNNISVVLQVMRSGLSVLLMGDLEYTGWQNLLARHPDITCDVLKFPHHGGTWTEVETDELLSTLSPSKVVISVGSDNTYDHPSAGVFAALRKQDGVQLLCTQATSACLAGASVESEISVITRKYQERAAVDSSFLVLPRRGHCPCAGTVIVELDDEVRVLQPDPAFHGSEVIHVHFRDHHKCRVAPVPVVTGAVR